MVMRRHAANKDGLLRRTAGVSLLFGQWMEATAGSIQTEKIV
jgi:hypothetical protein